MIRVGFILAQRDNSWIGGTNYLANLFHAIKANPDSRIEPVLFVSPATSGEILRAFPEIEIVRTSLTSGRSPKRLVAKMLEYGFGRNLILERLLRSHGVSLLSHAPPLGRRSKIPTIVWIPDFQHVRLPEFFSAKAIQKRNRNYLSVMDNATLVVLSSVDAQNDLRIFAPGSVSKSRVIHFVSGFGEGGAVIPLNELKQRYCFQGKYFHLPNQYWRHKNHDVVISALIILRSRGCRPLILSTGHTSDFRYPGHFDELMAKARLWDVADSFRPLGVVPYEDLKALMYHSVAVINPSHFEGWSTTVEESKSMGKTILLSDIVVHREQAPARGIYFDPDSPEELASAISATSDSFSVETEDRFIELARAELPMRFKEFARQYERIAFEAIGTNKFQDSVVHAC